MQQISHNLPSHAHFLTFSCYRRKQYLTSDVLRSRLVQEWSEARAKADFAIWSYVIMPEHVHLLLYPRSPGYQMSRVLRVLKEPFSRWVVSYWRESAPHLLKHIQVRRGGRILHRFWQEGGGYDRNLYSWETIRKAIEYIERNPVRRGMVKDPFEWRWSSAQARAEWEDVALTLDPFEVEAQSAS